MVFGLFSRKSNLSPRDPPLTPSPPPPDVSDLHSLILSIPPKTLHSYTLSHLSHLSPQSLSHITAFFAHLAPPPSLHCARCHKSFFDVENDDRSCLVPHDDDSAAVERIPLSKSRDSGVMYETLYACCARSVDGNGDMGPPDGWCYEGKHTTDPRRARFRADSTLQDDKLIPCDRLGCHDSPPPPRVRRKRGRPVAEDNVDDESDEESLSVLSSALSASASGSSSRRRKKARTRMDVKPGPLPPADDGTMDIDVLPPPEPVPAPTASASVVPPSPPKSKSNPDPKSKSKPKSKPRSKPTKPKSKLTAPSKSNDSPLVLSPPYITQHAPQEEALSRVIVSAGAGSSSFKSKSLLPVPLPSVGATPPTLKHKTSLGGASLKSPKESSPLAKVGTTVKSSGVGGKPRAGATGSGSGRGRGKTLAEVAVVESSVDAERVGGGGVVKS